MYTVDGHFGKLLAKRGMRGQRSGGVTTVSEYVRPSPRGSVGADNSKAITMTRNGERYFCRFRFQTCRLR